MGCVPSGGSDWTCINPKAEEKQDEKNSNHALLASPDAQFRTAVKPDPQQKQMSIAVPERSNRWKVTMLHSPQTPAKVIRYRGTGSQPSFGALPGIEQNAASQPSQSSANNQPPNQLSVPSTSTVEPAKLQTSQTSVREVQS